MTQTPPIAAFDAVPDMPDFLGTGGRVRNVASLLLHAQTQLVGLQAQMIVNGHTADDPVSVANDGGETAPTYGERAKQLQGGMAALMEANADIRDELIAAAVKSRQQQERDITG